MEEAQGMDLVYDWNTAGLTPQYPAQIFISDETLRDGLQSPSITHPSIQDKVYLLYLMRDLEIDIADLGLCGAGERFKNDVTVLAREIANQNMPIQPQSAARTLESDIAPIIDASQEAGIAIEAAVFLGSSPIRQYAEGWDLETLLKLTREAVKLAVDNDLPVMFVTEDTTRAQPEDLRAVYSEAMRAGAGRICVADTVGHATPDGVRNLIRFIVGVRDEVNPEVGIDWHGHRDRGMGLSNTFAALEAGADRVHACALGIGERSGNTPMEVLLVNLNLMGVANRDLSRIPEYCKVVSEACGVPIPFNYPIVGDDSFRTSTGVHAAAIVKAAGKNDDWLFNRVYCGVPSAMVGRKQDIEIGPMSGEANVRFWLESRDIEVNPVFCEKILAAAKNANTLLEEEMILRMVTVMRERMQKGEEISVDDLAAITENSG